MEYKSYEQMKEEFRNFYHSDAKGKLAEYEKFRKSNAPRIVCFYGVIFSIISLLFFAFFSIVHLAIISFVLAFVFAGLLLLGDKTNNNDDVNLHNSTEKILKNSLMDKFLNIFLDNAYWKADLSMNDLPKIKYYYSLNILSRAPFILFDDIIEGSFKDVKITIYEGNTSIFQFAALIFMVIVFAAFAAVLFFCFGILFFIATMLGSPFGFVVCGVLVLLGILCFFNYFFFYKQFRGLIIEIQMNKNFQGHTFFVDKTVGSRNIKFNKSLFESVKLETSKFSKLYNVYSNDQVEARYLLTTAFMDRICNLGLAFKAKSVCGAFKDDKLTLTINCGKDMFAMGSNFKESDSKTFAQLFNEMISILQIIDVLKLNERTGL